MNDDYNFEWKITNISFWNRDVHGKCIPIKDFYSSYCELYPKGFSGQEDYIVVRVSGDFYSFGVSLYDSDEFLICPKNGGECTNTDTTKQILYTYEIRFEDVVAKIKKKRLFQEDALILRSLVLMDFGENLHQRIYTVLDVIEIPLKIDEDMLKNRNAVPFVGFSSNKKEGGIFVSISDVDDRYDFQLDPRISDKCAFAVRSYASFMSENVLIRCDEKKHVFKGENIPWKFTDSMTKTEMDEKKVTLSLRLKLSTGGINNRYYHTPVSEDKAIPLKSIWNSKGGSVNTPNVSESELVALSKELECLYKNRDFSDFRFKCGDVSYPVHRAILSARSPVLKTMLLSGSKKMKTESEASSITVDIGELDPTTLEQFLTFLYTGTVEGMLNTESAPKLYITAHKYQVHTLKKKCVDFMVADIDFGTVCEVLKIADKYKDEDLASAAHAFIADNFWEVVGYDEWDDFKKSYPILAVNTVTDIARRKPVKNVH